jgi:hypothetical protein
VEGVKLVLSPFKGSNDLVDEDFFARDFVEIMPTLNISDCDRLLCCLSEALQCNQTKRHEKPQPVPNASSKFESSINQYGWRDCCYEGKDDVHSPLSTIY